MKSILLVSLLLLISCGKKAETNEDVRPPVIERIEDATISCYRIVEPKGDGYSQCRGGWVCQEKAK